jgi:nicotinate-nucleotide pyrophosphorylase (carboxylating)
MSGFSAAETAACMRLVELALREDLGASGSAWADVTSSQFLVFGTTGAATFVARKAGVIAGLPAAELVCAALDAQLKFACLVQDGAVVQPGERLATVGGHMTSILAAERTALNFLQHLSGIATLTQAYVRVVAGLPCQILDTRKTLPGWRLLEKYAVRCGGGHNHRLGLFDGILIKDNHWRAMPAHRTFAKDFASLRKDSAFVGFIEVEVETIEQLEEILAAGPDIVLLDNMTPDQLREAVRRRNAVAPKILLEASGGVNLQTVRAIAETGVDRISVGALTHSAPALDIALDYEPA